MRLTMKNPGGRNYRLACARESEEPDEKRIDIVK